MKYKWRYIVAGMIVIYLFAILSETLLFRNPFEGNHIQLMPFWSYSYKVIKLEFKQIVGNVVLFVPLGFLLALLYKKIGVMLLWGVLFSTAIELLQFLLKIGLCEFDDIFHNTLGMAIGLLLGRYVKKIFVDKGKP